jgi:tetratricopeptide (TPR) repeat protein
MSQLDRFLLAFRRDLLNACPHGLDHYVRLYWDDREAFFRAQEAAWGMQTPEPYLALTRARAMNEALSAKTARRYAHRLLHAGRAREAVDVLRDPRLGLHENASALLELARAELALGHTAEAAAAASQAMERDPGAAAPAAQIAHALTALRLAREAARASGAWPDARVLFDLWTEAGSIEDAAGVLEAFLARGRPLGQDDIHDFHAALDTVLSLQPSASAYNLFRGLARQPIYGKALEALEAVAAALYAGAGAAPGPIPQVGVMGPLVGGSMALALAQVGRGQEAIDLLAELSLAHHKQHHLRPALARLMGQEVLRTHPLRYAPDGGERKIFDVFLFNNELRILRMKLHEMADWVDAFVLVEARQTFTGAPKPLVFQEHREAFAAFADKIVHVVVDRFPDFVRHPWAREYYQRDMGVVGLSGRVREDDLVIISDSDEVISRDALKGFEGDYAPMGLERMRFFLNYRQALPPSRLRQYPSVWRARYLSSIGLSNARETIRADKKVVGVSPAGWHFTSVADAGGIAEKLSNTSHQQFAGATTQEVATLLEQLRAGRIEAGWERCEVDERFPAYLLQHLDDFEDLVL